MELLGIIIGAIGLIIAFVALRKDHYSEPKNERESLIVHFKATQKLSLQVQTELEEIVSRNNAYDSEMWAGISYRTCIDALKKSYSEKLSNELLKSMLELNPNKEILNSLIDSLKKQSDNLSLMQKDIRIRLNQY